MASASLAENYPEDGAFIDGFYLEGARWLLDSDADTQKVSGVEVQGELVESKLKELLSLMPVVYLKAVPVPKPPKNGEKPKQKLWTADSVGYIRNDPNIYECPIYQVRVDFVLFLCPAFLTHRRLHAARDAAPSDDVPREHVCLLSNAQNEQELPKVDPWRRCDDHAN